MKHFSIALVASLLMFSAAQAQTVDQSQARKTPSPEETQKSMEALFGSLSAVQTKAAEAAVELQLSMGERPETAERIAAFKKNLFEALRKRGFSAEQSLQIVIATSLPGAPMR